MNNEAKDRLPFQIRQGEDDEEVVGLIESWRYRGPAIGWEAVVGHEAQVRRCREIVEALRRPEADLERLRLRIGKGLLLSGPPGVGKSLMARALAGSVGGVGRELIAPPVSELTAGLIARLYAQLARMDPTVVVLDEAEPLVCHEYHGGDPDLVRALCVALDGLERPSRAPITLALTTADTFQLSPIATRPGRISPRLALSSPTAEERLVLLDLATDGLPIVGVPIDRVLVTERMSGWSGADITVAVEEAVSRSLLDHTDALTSENLLAVVAEEYVIRDPSARAVDPTRLLRIARHESGHLWAIRLRFGSGSVASISLRGETGGKTRMTDERFDQIITASAFVDLAAVHLAGLATEILVYGSEEVSHGSGDDRAKATELLVRARDASTPYDRDVLERGTSSDRGSERMRAVFHAAVEEDASRLLAEVLVELVPHRAAIEAIAQAVLAADEQTLSGIALEEVLGPLIRVSA